MTKLDFVTHLLLKLYFLFAVLGEISTGVLFSWLPRRVVRIRRGTGYGTGCVMVYDRNVIGFETQPRWGKKEVGRVSFTQGSGVPQPWAALCNPVRILQGSFPARDEIGFRHALALEIVFPFRGAGGTIYRRVVSWLPRRVNRIHRGTGYGSGDMVGARNTISRTSALRSTTS